MAVFQNQASLRYRGFTTQSNIVTGELTDSAAFAKTAVSQDYTPGGRIAYVLSLNNDGTEDMTGLTVTDDLGAGPAEKQPQYALSYVENSLLFYLNGVPQPAGALTVNPGPPLTVSGLDLPAGANALLVYEARVTPYAPLGEGAEITNTAALTGGATVLTAAATVPMSADSALTVAKSVEPAVVGENGQITYTFVLQNTGAAEAGAADGVVLSDVFDPILSDLTVLLNGEPLAETADYTYDAASGAFETVPGQITVPAATYAQNAEGAWVVTPGSAVLTVSGTV